MKEARELSDYIASVARTGERNLDMEDRLVDGIIASSLEITADRLRKTCPGHRGKAPAPCCCQTAEALTLAVQGIRRGDLSRAGEYGRCGAARSALHPSDD